MDMRIPPLEINILLASIPLKSRILVRRLAVGARAELPQAAGDLHASTQWGAAAVGADHWLPDGVRGRMLSLQECHRSPTCCNMCCFDAHIF